MTGYCERCNEPIAPRFIHRGVTQCVRCRAVTIAETRAQAEMEALTSEDRVIRRRARIRARSADFRQVERERIQWSGPLRDGLPLWRETEPGPLIASMGREVNWHPELRQAA